MTTDLSEATTAVPTLLAIAGISPSPEEVEKMSRDYPFIRMSAAALYTVPEARYEVPALIFDPVPSFADWS
ncbi:MAG TPA: hypothetical protein VG652_00780 [Gaiellaceae bacterium]|nr:hypothetical protein [Gaiellaceae bacterium]